MVRFVKKRRYASKRFDIYRLFTVFISVLLLSCYFIAKSVSIFPVIKDRFIEKVRYGAIHLNWLNRLGKLGK